MRVLKEMHSSIREIFADGGYRGEIVEIVKKTFGYFIKVVVSDYRQRGFRPIHKRWVEKRTFSWLDNNRRLCRNYELAFDSAEEMVKIASIKLPLNNIKQTLNST